MYVYVVNYHTLLPHTAILPHTTATHYYQTLLCVCVCVCVVEVDIDASVGHIMMSSVAEVSDYLL